MVACSTMYMVVAAVLARAFSLQYMYRILGRVIITQVAEACELYLQLSVPRCLGCMAELND
jgi:hypothetical protein